MTTMKNIIKMKSKKCSTSLLFIVAVQCLRLCSADTAPVYRLPSTVTPLSYVLRLEPDLDTNNVTGVVIIELLTTANTSTTESMDYFMLHLGADSKVNETGVVLMNSTGVIVPDLSFDYNDDDTTLKVQLPTGNNLTYNRIYMISLPFTSPLYSEPMGLFTGSYNSTSKYMASAFRATFARNVFPCFDEPQFQVPLTLQVVRPSSYSVVFTTALTSSSNISGNDTMLDTFEPTGNVSLSSLGLFMSQTSPVTVGNLSVYLPEGYNSTNTDWEVFLSDVTSALGPLPTPSSSLNLVVLPDLLYTSFSSLGFVFTTPEVYYGDVTSILQGQTLKQQLAEQFLQQYLAFTHTPQWWSDLWLSDSLAAYLAIMMLPQSTVEGLQTTQIRDSGLGNSFESCSGAVVDSKLVARLDIETAIVQKTMKNKGLSILTMWDNILPKGVVMQSVSDFVKLNQTLTNTADFVDILTAHIESNTTTYNGTMATDGLSNWLYTSGYPVVTVQPRNGTQVFLYQNSSCPNDTTVWPISISYNDNSSGNWSAVQQGLWMVSSNLTVNLTSNTSDWVIFNLENAPYRVNYNRSYEQVLSALKAANSSSVPATVRASLQSDAVALALAGSLNFSTALLLLQDTQHEQVDWLPVASALQAVTALIGSDSTGLADFGAYVKTLFSSELLAAVSLRNTTNNTDQWLARSLLTPWLCHFNISDCRSAASELSQVMLSAMSVTNGTDPNDVDNIVCQGARYGTTPVDTVLSSFAASTDLTERRLLALALSCVIDSESVQKVLSAISGNSSASSLNSSQRKLLAAASVSFTARETRDVLVGLASSVENSDAVVDFIVSEALNLENTVGSGYLADVIKTLGQFNVNLTKLESLAGSSALSSYVVQSVTQSVYNADISSTWWSDNSQTFEADISTSSTTATASSTTTAVPASSTTTKGTATTTKGTGTTTKGTATTTKGTGTTTNTTATSPVTKTSSTLAPTTASTATLHLINTQLFSLAMASFLIVLKFSF